MGAGNEGGGRKRRWGPKTKVGAGLGAGLGAGSWVVPGAGFISLRDNACPTFRRTRRKGCCEI